MIVQSADSEKKPSSDDELLQEARTRFKLVEEAEVELRRDALDDLEFRTGKHWPDHIKAERERDGRPCLVINKMPQFIQQVTNDQRQNRPSIKAHAVDDKADIETAKIIQGLIRHIEYNSSADVAYDTAFESTVTGGRGFFRVITDYASPMSFDQEILIKRILNPFSVFFDPNAKEPDGSDAMFCFVIENVSESEYKSKYKDSKLTSEADWSSIGNQAPGWITGKACRVAEYFYKEFEQREICLLSDGQVVLKNDLGLLPEGVTVAAERTAQIPVIKWCKINGSEILEKRDWLGIYIPIIPVYGTELDVNGKRVLEGVVRNAKDPARMYDYWASAETEAIALAPRVPFIAADGQLEGHEDEWATANKRNHAYLTYKPITNAGQAVPPPQRNAFEPAVQAITQARMMASDDLKSTTGIYDAALGARSNETSGIAIQRRNVQAQTSNFHLIDNLTRSLRHCGRVLVDLIPKIYDTARTARIIGEDGEQKVVRINQPFEENGKQVLYAMDAGKYDVTVDVGPSFASKRQEAASAMLEVTKALPQLMQVAGDLLVKNMDWPGAQELSERIKKTIPPNLIDDPKAKSQDIPQHIQAQMQQMSQMVEQLTGKLNEAQDAQDKKLIEIESRERIEMKKLEVQLEIERSKIDAKDALALLSAEIAEIEGRQRLLRANEPIEDSPATTDDVAPMDSMGGEAPGGEGYPTGGESPGLPMEQSNDDRSIF